MKDITIFTKCRDYRTYKLKDCKIHYNEGVIEPFYNGLTIFKGRNSWLDNYDYYIIDEHFTDYFYKVFIAIKDTEINIERDKNMFFIVSAMEKYNYRTFPGKNRETEYDLRPIILAILDDNGNLLDKEDKEKYIASNSTIPYASKKSDLT